MLRGFGSWLSFLVALWSTSACAAHRPKPLYAPSEAPASPAEASTLYGDVREVDGKIVSEHGGSFELLPGCHVVRVVEKWGRFEQSSGGVVVDLPRIVYAMPMRAGHRYIVEVKTNDINGTFGHVTVEAREEDANGEVTRMFQQAGEAEQQACAAARTG